MRMYEKMKIDPTTEEGILNIMTVTCPEIPDEMGRNMAGGGRCPKLVKCEECKAKRLAAEVPTKKVQRGTTYTDFNKAWEDFNRAFDKTHNVFHEWLAEEIEVEE